MNTRPLVLVSLLILQAIGLAQDGEAASEQFWADFYDYRRVGPKIEYCGDLGFRYVFSESHWSRLSANPSLAYRWSLPLSLHGGMLAAHTRQDPGANATEIRPWLGLKVRWPRLGRVSLTHYLRLEQRLQTQPEIEAWSSRTRWRYQLSTVVPLNNAAVGPGTWYLPSSVEFFRDPPSEVQEGFASRRRLSIGVGYCFDPRWRLEGEFTNQASRDSRLAVFQGTDNVFHLKVRWYH